MALLYHIYTLPTYLLHRRARGGVVGGRVGWWGHGGAARRRWCGCFGPWGARAACFCPCLRDGRAFTSFLRVLRTMWAVACAHCGAQTFCYTWVCLLCVCGSGIFSPLDPLTLWANWLLTILTSDERKLAARSCQTHGAARFTTAPKVDYRQLCWYCQAITKSREASVAIASSKFQAYRSCCYCHALAS